MSKKKDIIRVGDYVKVLRPHYIERVGYDNNLKDTAIMVEEKYSSEIHDLVRSIAKQEGLPSKNLPQQAKQKIASAIGYALVGFKMSSGAERKIFFYPENSDIPFGGPRVGDTYKVQEIKMVQTGTYFPPYYGRDGESDPGGLMNPKTHKLLQLDWFGPWMEVVDVEKVPAPEFKAIEIS